MSSIIASKAIKKQIFMSHPWAKDEMGRNTHARAKKLSSELNFLGWTTWVDENEMVGNIDAAMANGIDDADVVVVCLTKEYCQKVSSAAANLRTRDNCLNEWTYANNRKKALLPVVMEPCMRNPSDWPSGVVAMYFGGMLYADASDSDDMKEPAKQVNVMLQRMNIHKTEKNEMPCFRRRSSSASSSSSLEHRPPPPPPLTVNRENAYKINFHKTRVVHIT